MNSEPALTQLCKMQPEARVPIVMEIPVSSDLEGPFLVTSLKQILWVEKRNNVIRVAPQKVELSTLQRKLVEMTCEAATRFEWGSVHLPTDSGVAAALSHLASFGIFELEILFGDNFEQALIPESVLSSQASWVPEDWAIVLPIDRGLLGTRFEFSSETSAVVLHNASRGIAFLRPLAA